MRCSSLTTVAGTSTNPSSTSATKVHSPNAEEYLFLSTEVFRMEGYLGKPSCPGRCTSTHSSYYAFSRSVNSLHEHELN